MSPDTQSTAVVARVGDGQPVQSAIELACPNCEVTWRAFVGAPCWSCGAVGIVANPDRLLLD